MYWCVFRRVIRERGYRILDNSTSLPFSCAPFLIEESAFFRFSFVRGSLRGREVIFTKIISRIAVEYIIEGAETRSSNEKKRQQLVSL